MQHKECPVEHLLCAPVRRKVQCGWCDDIIGPNIDKNIEIKVWLCLITWTRNEKLAFHSSSYDSCLQDMYKF